MINKYKYNGLVWCFNKHIEIPEKQYKNCYICDLCITSLHAFDTNSYHEKIKIDKLKTREEKLKRILK